MDELIKRQDVIDAMTMVYRYEMDRLTAVQELPTVDIGKILDKIVKRLEAERNEMYRADGSLMSARTNISIDKAIEIVKSGGIE